MCAADNIRQNNILAWFDVWHNIVQLCINQVTDLLPNRNYISDFPTTTTIGAIAERASTTPITESPMHVCGTENIVSPF